MEKSNFLKYPSEYELQKKNRNLKSAVLQMLNLNDSLVKGGEKNIAWQQPHYALNQSCFVFFSFRTCLCDHRTLENPTRQTDK